MVNPPVQTMAPGRNCFRNQTIVTSRRRVKFPGGRLLWEGVAKAALVSILFLFAFSFWSVSSINQVNEEIGTAKALHAELVKENSLLQKQRAVLFSSKEVGRRAEKNLALYFPDLDQYRRKF
ncbi:MAG: hypothetical protein ABFR63_06415 [Thermodesulfobacteriota bacterium]